MWTRRLLIACFLLSAAGLLARPAAAQPAEEEAGPGDCPMAFNVPLAVECGMVAVPEDHRHPNGAEIQIAYARLSSTAADPAPDPILFIGGGPGSPVLRNIEAATRAAAPLLAQRDVILFDQRGVGFSQPGVDCPELTAVYVDQLLERSPNMTDAAEACHQRLSASGVNLSAYTTPQVAADIPYLIEALGYEAWNIYGVSYGTLVALVLMDQQPPGLHSVVLESLLIPDADVIGDRARLGAASFVDFFESCEADWLCRIAYPDLDAAYDEALDRLDTEPITRTIADPAGGQPITLRVDGAVFASAAAGMLNTDKGRAGLPGFIYAGRDGLVDDLLDRQEDQYSYFLATVGIPGTAGNGMGLGVICADFGPRADLDAVPEVERFPVIGGSARGMLEPCSAWPTEGSDALPARSTRSSIPTLIFSGGYDSSTPPSYSQHAAETLSNSQIVHFPRTGHGDESSEQCHAEIAGAFYNQPQERVETGCVDRQPAAPLIITVGATRPLARWVMLPVFALVGIVMIVMTSRGIIRLMAQRQTTFRKAMQRNVWLGIVISGVLLSLQITVAGLEHPLDNVISIMPAVIAVHIALVTTPNEEPYLEVLLACPRPFYWIMVERWLVVAGLQLPIAVLGIAASAPFLHDGDITYAITQTIPAALLLSGLAALVSVRSKSASMGAIMAILGACLFVARNHLLLITGLETPLPRPLDLVQSVFWMVHPYLEPNGLTPADYLMNRVIVAGLGLALFGRAQALLSNAEYLLVGERVRWLRKRTGQQ